MDAQIVHRFQTEEQAKEQYQSFEITKRVEIDPMNQLAQALNRKNRKKSSSGQVRPNRY